MTTPRPVRLVLPWPDAAAAEGHLDRTDPAGRLLITRELAREVASRRQFCEWEECGKPIVASREHRRFCSSRCRSLSWAADHRGREG